MHVTNILPRILVKVNSNWNLEVTCGIESQLVGISNEFNRLASSMHAGIVNNAPYFEANATLKAYQQVKIQGKISSNSTRKIKVTKSWKSISSSLSKNSSLANSFYKMQLTYEIIKGTYLKAKVNYSDKYKRIDKTLGVIIDVGEYTKLSYYFENKSIGSI